VDVQEGDVEAPDFELPGGGFGAVVLDSVLEHFRWPRQVIAKCARALRPGGGLLIWTMANDGDALTREGAAFMYFGPSEHLFYFSATSLCRMCEDAGFRVERLWRDETADSIVLLARRRLDVESGPA
jgi:SAM-dependent methyltransferase